MSKKPTDIAISLIIHDLHLLERHIGLLIDVSDDDNYKVYLKSFKDMLSEKREQFNRRSTMCNYEFNIVVDGRFNTEVIDDLLKRMKDTRNHGEEQKDC